MNSNTPQYCPVCYTSIKTNRDHETEQTSAAPTLATSTAAVESDVLLHHGTSIQLFRNDGTGFTHSVQRRRAVPGSWQFKPNDQIIVGDFNGDGIDEVVIFNGVDWAMPYLGLLVPTAPVA